MKIKRFKLNLLLFEVMIENQFERLKAPLEKKNGNNDGIFPLIKNQHGGNFTHIYKYND
jgi:hypothetical protein